MTIGTSLRSAARKLISDFGNTASVYTYSTATKSENEEGDVTVSSWGSAASVLMVDGDYIKNSLLLENQGIESMGSDEKAVRDDTTIVVNDRMTMNSEEFKVTQVKPISIQDTLVVQFVSFEKVTDTTNW